jgi:DNA invertase Pin-like site-specific DNA recombinase
VNNPSGQKTRAIIYVRVSTDKQGESGLGLEAQRNKCIQFAALYEIDVVEIVTDVESGKDLDREGLQKALAALESGAANAILIYDLDRLTRDVADGASLIKKWFSEGSDYLLLSVNDKIDTSTPEGELVLTVKLAVAQYERKKTIQRTKNALSVKKVQLAAEGKQLGAPRVEEAAPEAVKLILELKKQGHSQRAIADILNQRGIPSAKGGTWRQNLVWRILDRAEKAQFQDADAKE